MPRSIPVIALTIGDVSGIGPEVALKASQDQQVLNCCRPLLIGHPKIIKNVASSLHLSIDLQEIDSPAKIISAQITPEKFSAGKVFCWNPVSGSQKDSVLKSKINKIDSHAGDAAYQYLIAAIELAVSNQIDAITTAPISKAALHSAGHYFPGHTEILAEKCSVPNFGMMLYLPPGERILSPNGLGVVHATLHTSIDSVPKLLTQKGIQEKIELINQFMEKVGCNNPRIGVCALNPHAGEEGLFGNEEEQFIKPAVQNAINLSVNASGPFPADTLLKRASEGEFDGIVAMYHDQGHIAFKLLGFHQAVNVTLGLPFVRTSPSHGTAFDIAGQGKADHRGMVEAILLASKLTGQ